MFSTDPNFKRRDFFLLGPIPDRSSKIERTDVLPLRKRWAVIAKRCASSLIRWIKNNKGFPYIEIQVFKRITRNVVDGVMIGEEIEGWCITISTDQVDEYIKALKKCSTLLKKEKRKIERVLDDKPFD